jgi:hypothetical protein
VSYVTLIPFADASAGAEEPLTRRDRIALEHQPLPLGEALHHLRIESMPAKGAGISCSFIQAVLELEK